MDDLERYLKEFALVADEWFAERLFVDEYHQFFQHFFEKHNLKRIEWEDIQKLGDNIHSLAGNAMARKRAFGHANYPIEAYRKSFFFIAHGPGTVEERMREFTTNKAHTNKFLGRSSISEIFTQLNADRYVFFNRRDRKSAELLGFSPIFSRGDDLAAKFEKFNSTLRPIFEEYERIVGARTNVSLGLEIDQFLSWFYEKNISEKNNANEQPVWLIATGEGGRLWDFFREEGVIAIGMPALGDLRAFNTPDEIRERLTQIQPDIQNPMHDVKASWEFSRKMKVGDLVFAKQGRHRIVGYGEVTGDYQYDENQREYKNLIPVNWKDTTGWTKDGKSLVTKTLTNISNRPQMITELKELVGIDDDIIDGIPDYWWLNCNPSMWRVSEWREGQRQTYTTYNEAGNKRRIYEHFRSAKVGDMIVGYETSPERRITSLLKFTKGIHRRDNKEVVEFELVRHFVERPSWDDLKQDDALLECEPLKNNQGSLFSLTEEEYLRIVALAEADEAEPELESYTIEDATKELFMSRDDFSSIVQRLKTKHNIILQGPPGVGKTFIAERIAFALMEQKARNRLKMVQFHQSYSYEDFIMGFRPNNDGNFALKNGVFYEFCETARPDSSNEYVFIIDEINRGNLSKIMGEMMMLIEGDKRSPQYATPLTYQDPKTDKPFYVPENVYIIGMMNTADRSLAMVDYALRRRFSFIDLPPAFEGSIQFESFLLERCKSEDLAKHILSRFTNLNRMISEDASLGEGFAIGHSYFCPSNTKEEIDEDLYEQIVDMEIAPLLKEYWFDDNKAASERIRELYVTHRP